MIVAWGPSRLRFFARGWGDPALLEPPDISPRIAQPIHPVWLSDERFDGGLLRRGVYDGVADALPARSRTGSIISISPIAPHHRTVVLMAAWNEHDPRVRVSLARHLARLGIASLIPENPYYGSRRPDPTIHQPIETVSDFMRMGIAAVAEGAGLLAGVRERGNEPGVSGYSMGGNVAALISSITPFPVATAPLAASHSPAPVFLDGVLREGIAWGALGGKPEARDRLRRVLGSVSVLRASPPPHAAHAIIVGGRSDGYIPAAATTDLANHWQGSDLRWFRGGHATVVWYRKAQLARIVAESFDRVFGATSATV